MSILQVGPDKQYKALREAGAKVADGDTIEIDAGRYVGKDAVCACTVDNITIKAVGGRVELNARGADGKAYNVYDHGILSLNGKGSTIEGIDFVGASVGAKNGSGIRIVGGGLHTIRNCGLYHNQDGIMTVDKAEMELIVEDSYFSDNGHGDSQSHNIYVGKIARYEFRRCYSVRSNKGQAIKARAAKSLIEYCVIGDKDGTTNYELDFSNGGEVEVRGCLIMQPGTTANGHIIAIGSEGALHPNSSLLLSGNTIIGYRSVNYFVRSFNGVPVRSRNNVMAGQIDAASGIYLGGAPLEDVGNVHRAKIADMKLMGDADYRPGPGSPALGAAVAPIESQQIKFPYPLSLEPRVALDAGAFGGGATSTYERPALPYPAPGVANGFEKVSMGGTPPPPVVTPPVVTPPVVTPAPGTEEKILITRQGVEIEIIVRVPKQ